MGTIIVGIIVAGCAALAIRSIILDKKNKKSSCGCGCGGCKGCH